MKPITYSLLFSIILSCAPGKNNETATDSTQIIATDTLATQVEENSTFSTGESGQSLSPYDTSEPPSGITSNFPEVSMEALTSDTLEAKINNQIAELAQAYDTMRYATVTSSYSWERPYCYPSQDGPCSMGTQTEEEIKKWFFDRSYKLRGFSREFKIGLLDPVTKSTLYFFSNDSLTAVREQSVYSGDFGYTNHLTIIAAQCPRCGISITNDGQVSYMNEKDLATTQQEFYESMSELISILKASQKKAKADGDYFIFSVNRTEEGNAEEKSKAITYPVEFRVTKELYPNYISKQ